MKKFMALSLGLLLCEPSIASTDFCKEVDGAAKSVMTARQRGVAMADVYEVTNKMDGYLQGLFRMAIKEAYSKPRFSSEEYQEKAVADFRSDMFQACLSNEDEKKR